VNAMEFACDAVQEATLASAAQWLGSHAKSSLASWLMVDAALLDSARLSTVVAAAGSQCVNSLGRSPLAVFGDAAPQLVAVHDEAHALELLSRLAFRNRTTPGFSFFVSAASISELQNLFGYLALPVVEDGLELHCRFADTRVLPSLLRNLSPPQASRVAEVIDEWRWFGRTNDIDRWCALDVVAQSDSTPDASPRITLKNTQFASMLDASEADTMFSILVDKTPEVVASERRGQFHARLRRHLGVATARCVTQPADRLQFVVLSLTCGEHFDLHPSLESTWKSIRESKTSLTGLMKAWSDELWSELQRMEGATT